MQARDAERALEELVDPELAAAFQAAAVQHRDAIIGAVMPQLLLVQARGTPLRVVTKFSNGVARLQFADHTAVLVNADGPRRRISALGVAVAQRHAVLVTAVHDDGQHLKARLRWDDHVVDVEVLGGDQLT